VKSVIVGFGSIGKRHLENLINLGEKDIVLLRTYHSTLKDSGYDTVPVVTSMDDALALKPDAVIIANPTKLHMQTAIPVAEAGCSILMEKPISDSFSGIDTLKRALEIGGGRFLTGFHFRFNPGLRQAKKWLQENKIGKVVSAYVCWGEYLPDWHPWEDYRQSYAARADLGGGVVNTLCHPLDYLRWLLGEGITLNATISNQGLSLDVEDTADIIAQYESGAQAHIHLDYMQRPGEHTLKIIGTEGMITWDNATTIARCYLAALNTWEEVQPPTGFVRNTMFMDEMRHFIKVARGETDPICTLDDGIAALEMTQAILQSARTGCSAKLRKSLN
jgi:predicted dehydrogenase